MKKIDFTEFQNRINEVNKAYRIFSPLTNNMTEAFRLYQEVLAEEKMEVFISTATSGNKPLSPLDDFERPKCPECQTDLRLRVGAKDENEKAWNTAWFCEKCQAEFYSDKTVQEWMNELQRRDVQEQ
jgi:transposase-like protein